MKVLKLSLVAAVFFVACSNNPKGDKATTADAEAVESVDGETLNVDPATSGITWTGSKVTGSHNGTINIQSGNVVLNEGKLAGGEFVIDMTSLTNKDLEADAENKAKLEGHLKADDFFAVEKYPTSKFVITKVTYKEDGKAEIAGNLTLRDVTKNISFMADAPAATEQGFHAMADFNINRKDWGVMYEGMKDDLIADEINLKVHLMAKK
ncbi:YceI family protein [Pedobacter glucosidilyticus]|uniref:YceI family protein n=1 Tax=Pedobacter glucosidilyticus TaxID=1122941 RepID=UPI0026F0F6E6|nr:YceI family protein [Pedobacter glucosidilyticus]